jgi:type IV secretion system protein VirB6/type IV secretion system protein TrbL
MKVWSVIVLAAVMFCCLPAPADAQTAGGNGVLDTISSQFTTSTKKWETSIKEHAVKLFWILASIAAAWTFIQLVLKEADFADLFGAVTRFMFITFFFYWILDHGGDFATKIMQSTQQVGDDAAGSKGLDWGAFIQAGIDILLGVNGKITFWDPITGLCALLLALLILIALCLISLNIILVTAQTWIIAYSGLIFLGFGAAEWTREMSVGYYKTMLAFGVKLMVTLLLGAIALDILHQVEAQSGNGWGTDVALLARAMASAAILLGIIAKAPDCVASIAGISTGGFDHGVGTFVAAAGIGAQAGAWAAGAAAQGGKQLGTAVRNAVKQGQTLSRGR